MFSHNFWTVVVVIKVILYVGLIYYLTQTRKSIDNIDALGIKNNFRNVELITYTLIMFHYALFAMKFFKDPKKEDIHHMKYRGVSYVNMAVIIVFYTFVRHSRHAMNIAERGSVPLTFIDANFKFTENLGYILGVFNIVTTGVIILSKNKDRISLSPRSREILGMR